MESAKQINILLGCTGSVASIKIPELVDKLLQLPNTQDNIAVNVQVVSTEHALHFFDPQSVKVKVYRDADEWQAWKARSDPVLHIELRKWADVFVIAPLDANTLGKLANGLCDNLLTCIARAWDIQKPLLFAPAMNTVMYNHPLTEQHITTLESFGYRQIPSVKKLLACGDEGIGAMAELDTIVQQVLQSIS